MSTLFSRCLKSCMRIGSSPNDGEGLAIKKSSLVLVPLIIGVAAFIWGVLYIILDHYLSASIPLSYALISLFNLWHFHRTKNIVPLYKIQMLLVLFLPFFLMWSLGGFALGSFVFIWAFYAPIAALTYEKENKAQYWFYTFLLLILLSTLIDQWLIHNTAMPMPEAAVKLFYWLNISAGLAGIFFLIRYFITSKEKAANVRLKRKNDALIAKTQELKSVNEKLSYYANHDALTDLSNRYHLESTLQEMLQKAKEESCSVAVLFIDLDGFKEINNRYGHNKGDEFLAIIAQRLKSLLGEEDVIARVGGDEFVLVLGRLKELSPVVKKAEEVIEILNQEHAFLSSAFSLGASIGISLYPKHTSDMQTLLNLADKAMYKVKESTKNSFLFYEPRMEKAD